MKFSPSYFRSNTIAVDVSDRSLKCAQMQRKKGMAVLTSYNILSLEEGLLVGGEIRQEDKLRERLYELLQNPKGSPFTGNQVNACLPEQKTFVKLIDLPGDLASATADTIPKLLEQHIPVPLDHVYYDWMAVPRTDTTLPQQILAATIEQSIVDSYLRLFEHAGLVPVSLEVEALAIIRTIFRENPKDPAQPATLVIDIGASRSSIMVYDNQTVQFTVSVPVSAHHIRSVIQDTLQLTESQAEKAMIICGLNERKGKGAVRIILQHTMLELVQHIREAINFYYDHFPRHHTIERIILSGGGANFSGLDAFLAKELSLTVVQDNPLAHVALASGLSLLPNQSRSLTTAIGLSLATIHTSYA